MDTSQILKGYKGYGMECHYAVLLMQLDRSKVKNRTASKVREIIVEDNNLQADYHEESRNYFSKLKQYCHKKKDCKLSNV